MSAALGLHPLRPGSGFPCAENDKALPLKLAGGGALCYNRAQGACSVLGAKAMVMELKLGDVLRLRKPHPCGSYEWLVVRLGADIGIKCQKCRRRVLLPRRALERQVKQFVARGGHAAAES